MKSTTDAAHYLRMIWQGHDEQSKEMCESGAFGLYDILAPSALGFNKAQAAELVMKAFWLADEAESWQGRSLTEENQLYSQAGSNLKKSRELVGLETKSVGFTIDWWRSYRHKDRKAVLENLVKEHVCQLNCVNPLDIARKCAGIIVEAATEHQKRNWEACEAKLQEYFEVYLPAFLNKF
jgi:hypothetical protein